MARSKGTPHPKMTKHTWKTYAHLLEQRCYALRRASPDLGGPAGVFEEVRASNLLKDLARHRPEGISGTHMQAYAAEPNRRASGERP